MTVEPTFEHTDMGPAQVEQKLRFLHDELGRATDLLRDARQVELAAQTALTSAKAAATLAPDRLRPGVGPDGVRVTVAEAAAWVDIRIAPQVVAYETAKTTRQAAADYLKTVRDQLAAVQSINASVREAYRGIGATR